LTGPTDRPSQPERDKPASPAPGRSPDVVDPSFREAPPTPPADRAAPTDGPGLGENPVPHSPDKLPDGRETVVVGDPQRFAANCHQQGVGDYQGTCGVASCEQVLRQFGHDGATEKDLVATAAANGLCETGQQPGVNGATTPHERVQIMNQAGEPAHIEVVGHADDVRSLVEDGRGVIVRANAGELWNDPSAYEQGQYNHAVSVTGVAAEPKTGATQGFYINDTGTGEGGRFVPTEQFQRSCFDADPARDNLAVVTDRRWPDVEKS